ncbi:uncharacterized protein EV422DRAFT_563870 [Fimicolochytrium jonesii]|uniref:uncharacterized protein n=1 Tax=Fimicolochytrium jonesii TaxID=1396493 RepID=UPI0022FDD2D1|nr:uncharacterized protein EV422DRAFT_563870 [Fimicolochytrium jonesii]KAI8826059.1 hypothetical protein EV422DRAFT_563870 [Fimicolochytrium jonesii]
MYSLRIARAALVRPALKISAPSATRGFAQTASVKADIISQIYLQQLKAYTPPKDTGAKVDLPTSFAAPAPPPKPELDVTVAEASGAVEQGVEEEQWPPVYNPIDDPANYPDEYDFTTDNDDGALFPKRLHPIDYFHH